MCAGKLQEQRERLLRFIEEKRPCGNNSATVVFDGKPRRDWNGWPSATQVILSQDIDANTEIKNRVDAMSNPASAVVVTNDRAIQIWVRGAGAKVMSCSDFLRAGPGAVGNSMAPALSAHSNGVCPSLCGGRDACRARRTGRGRRLPRRRRGRRMAWPAPWLDDGLVSFIVPKGPASVHPPGLSAIAPPRPRRSLGFMPQASSDAGKCSCYPC